MTTTIERGLEIVPGYTLVRRLGSGMSGEVWVARASGGVHVAIKLIKDLNLVGSRRELGALRVVREVKHPNLCPLIGVWFIDANGELLSNSDTDAILGHGSSLVDTSCLQTLYVSESSAEVKAVPDEGRDEETQVWQVDQPTPGLSFKDAPPIDPTATRPAENIPREQTSRADASHDNISRDSNALSAISESLLKKAAAMVIAMGLGEKTLHDRLIEMRAPGNQPAPDADPVDHIPGGIEVHELLRYVTAAASAIDELNLKYKIYHCDIKPQNILVVGGQAQVCDFGLAREVPDSRQTLLAIGTPAYGAPEMMFDHRYSRTIDQYSLAVTYYELRTSQLPFETNRRSSFLRLKATGELDFSLVTPPEKTVVARATHLDPELRYDTCTQFVEALTAAIALAKQKPQPKHSINKMWPMAALVLLTTSFASAAWWNSTRRSDPGVAITDVPSPVVTSPTKTTDQEVEPVVDLTLEPTAIATAEALKEPEVASMQEPTKIASPEPMPVKTPPQVLLLVDRDTSQAPNSQLLSIAESLNSWLADRHATADAKSLGKLFDALEELLPFPTLVATAKKPELIPVSITTELIAGVAKLGSHLDRLGFPGLMDRWHVLRLRLNVLVAAHDRAIAAEVRQRVDAAESSLTPTQKDAAAICLLAVAPTESVEDWRNLQMDLQRALVAFESDPAVAQSLAQRWVLHFNQLQTWVDREKPSLAPEEMNSAGQLLEQWFEPMANGLRSQTAGRLLETLRRGSGVGDDEIEDVRYRGSSQRAESVLDLCDRLLPTDDVLGRSVETERLLLSIANSDIPGVGGSLKILDAKIDWTPQIRHALTQFIRQVVKLDESGTMNAPEELPRGILAELAEPVWRSEIDQVATSNDVADLGDLMFFGEIVFQCSDDPKLIGESGVTLMESFFQQNANLLDRWDIQTLIPPLHRWRDHQTAAPWSLVLKGRCDDLEGAFCDSESEMAQRYADAQLSYDQAIEHKDMPSDLKGAMVRHRADLKLRRALMIEGTSRQQLLDEAAADSRASLELPNRWWKDSDERLETVADVVWRKLVLSPTLASTEKNASLDQLETLWAQAIDDRRRHGEETLTLAAKRLDGYWMDMMTNRVDDFARYQDRQTKAFQWLKLQMTTGPMSNRDAKVESSAVTDSDFARCQWHRSVARVMDFVERHEEALVHEQFAANLAADRLMSNRPLVHATILETVVLRGRLVTESGDAKNQQLIEELLGQLNAIANATPEVTRQRDRLLAELNKLRR